MFLSIILSLIVGILIGIGICIWRVYPQLRVYEIENEKIRQQNCELEEYHKELLFQTKETDDYLIHLKGQVAILENKRDDISHSINDLKLQADEAGQKFYDQAMENMQLKLEQSAEQERIKYQKAQEEYEYEYKELLASCVRDFNTSIQSMQLEQSELKQSLLDARAIVASAVAANKRAYEIAEQDKFYKLNLSHEDLQEIEKLKSILPYLRDPEALNKVIWKVYYEKPYTDLVGRVIGPNIKTGIYKITNQLNQLCYVGQAVDLASRWKQHIKRGIGAEPPTKNKLYPAMLKDGVENFTFEIIEECDRSLLNSREDFWQEHFEAKTFGYSIK